MLDIRFMKSELRNLNFLCSDLDVGNVCPACPKVFCHQIIVSLVLFFLFFFLYKERGTVILSMDALFGLPRKRSSGVSHQEPLNTNVFFLSQEKVDSFINCHNVVSYDNVRF